VGDVVTHRVSTLTIDGRTLTAGRLAAQVAGPVRVRLSATARRRAQASFEAATAAVEQRPVYGRTTGVGANRSIIMDGAQAASGVGHTLALLRSHATSAGPLRGPDRVRATLVIRLNQLAAGGSGISPAAIDALAAMINADALPPIREHSGIGTGDLTALATTALGLLGEAPLTAPLRPVSLGVHDALPFVSSNAATLADAAIATARLQTLCTASLAVAALTGVAVSANLEAFGPVVLRATPGAGARRVCRTVLALADPDGDGTPTPPEGGWARIQDPFAMRCLPQVNGLLIDALDRLGQVVDDHLNVAAENPLIVSLARPSDPPGDATAALVAHHGGFYIPAVSLACDSAAIAVAQAVPLLLGRLAMLIDPASTGLPAFLSDGTPGASGVMMLEYLAASALAELRASASPASLGSVSLSRGTEEHASFASQAAVQLLASADAYATALACELVAAVRAVRMRGLPVPDGGWGAVLRECEELGHSTEDRDLTADLEQAEHLLPTLAAIAGSST
jgi:histidine ammonia-lyase